MPKKTAWKKLWNQRWRPRSGCEGRIMAKFLIKTIQANLCCFLQDSLGIDTKFTWIVVNKNFAIILLSQPATFDFTTFFHAVFFGMDHTFFYSLAVYCVDRVLNTYIYIYIKSVFSILLSIVGTTLANSANN